MVNEGLIAAQLLAQKRIHAEVINLHTIKPLDKEALLRSLHKTGRLLTIEEHQVAGGMGSAILEAVASEFSGSIKLLGVRDAFGESGEPAQLIEKHKLSAKHIVHAAEQLVK
jgi:transketolase